MASEFLTVEEIFNDFSARRIALIHALTRDVEKFFELCDPDKDILCLYGHPNKTWEVALPTENVPPEIPDPTLGINIARSDKHRRDWLSLVAIHSDSWLISVAFRFGSCLNQHGRNRLFKLINRLPTVFEVVTGKKPIEDKPTVASGSISQGITKRSSDGQVKSNPKSADEGYEGDADEDKQTLCGICGLTEGYDEFWIFCDTCNRWFHGECVKITPAKAERIKKYKCPSCMQAGRALD